MSLTHSLLQTLNQVVTTSANTTPDELLIRCETSGRHSCWTGRCSCETLLLKDLGKEKKCAQMNR